MKKKTKKAGRPSRLSRLDNAWAELRRTIEDYADAQVADSWKGGGDPASYETIEAQLALSRARLNEQIVVLRREYE